MDIDFNTDLEDPEGHAWDEEITASLSTVGPEDMIGNFLPRRKPWLRDGRMLSMLYGGKEVRSQTSYILGTYRPLLQNVVVRGVYHNTDHYLVLGCLRKSAPDAHSCYLREQTRFPIKPTMTLGGVDRLFSELWGGVGSQSTLVGTPWPGLDFTGKLATYRHQYFGTPVQGRCTAEHSKTQTSYQGKSSGGPVPKGVQVGVRGESPPRF